MTQIEQKYLAIIAQTMKTERKKRKLTQHDVAHELGVSQSLISKFESGVLVPSVVVWFNFCRFVKIDPCPPVLQLP